MGQAMTYNGQHAVDYNLAVVVRLVGLFVLANYHRQL